MRLLNRIVDNFFNPNGTEYPWETGEPPDLFLAGMNVDLDKLPAVGELVVFTREDDGAKYVLLHADTYRSLLAKIGVKELDPI